MVRINDDFQKIIPPLTTEEYARLEESLKIEGCRDALVVWGDILIDGHNRFKICQQYNISYEKYYVKFDDENQAKIWIINNQLARRNLTLEQRNYLTGILGQNAPSQRKLAKEQKIDKRTVQRAIEYSKHVDSIDNEKTKQKILTRQIKSTKESVKDLSQMKPNEQERVIIRAEEKKINLKDSVREIKKEIKKEKLVEKPIPEEKFNIIYADPPWKYDFSISKNRDIENQYPTMELEQIKKLKLPISDNAVLLLWNTAPKLKEGFEVLESWGFKYKTQAVWDKEIIGCGWWFRGQHETLLIGVKGKVSPPKPENRFPSVIKKRRTKHSKKPDVVYEMIEKMFPNGKLLEVFAREKYNDKWTPWGNEI